MSLRNCISALVLSVACWDVSYAQTPEPPASMPWEMGTKLREGHYQRRVLEELWQARAYDTAEVYCKQYRALLAKESDPYALWTLWMMEGLGRRRLDNPQRANEIAEQLKQLVQEFERAESPRQPWVLLQAIRCQWMQASSELTTFLASSGKVDARDRALEIIREQLDALETLSLEVSDLLAKSSRTGAKSPSTKSSSKMSSLKSEEVQGLANELLLLRIDCLNVRCQCYPEGSNDIIGAASQMLKAIEDARLRIPADWVGNPRLSLARAKASIYLQEYEQARASCQAGLDGLKDLSLLPRLQATMSDIYRLQGKSSDAAQAIEVAGGWSVAPELALASLELRLSQLGDSQQTPKAAIQELLEFKKQVGERFGDYWMRRAEVALLRVVKSDQLASGTASANVMTELLKTEAKQLLGAGKWEQALGRLLQAEEAFAREQNFAQALATAMEAAAIQQKFGRLEKAISLFREAGLKYASESGASSSHLMACWLMQAEVVKRGAARADASNQAPSPSPLTWKELTPVLLEHTERWPRSPSSQQVRAWLDLHWLESEDRSVCLAMWRQAVAEEPSNTISMSYLMSRSLQEILIGKYFGDGSMDAVDKALEAWGEIARTTKPAKPSEGWVMMTELAMDRRWQSVDGVPQTGYTRKDLIPSPPFDDAASWKACLERMRKLMELQATDRETIWLELQGLMDEEPSRWQLVWPLAEVVFDSLEYRSQADRQAWAEIVKSMGERVGQHASTASEPNLALLRSEVLVMHARSWLKELDPETLAGEMRRRYVRNANVELEIAKMFRMMDDDNEKRSLERAFQIYRQLAKGSKVGGSVWLEASFRAAQCLGLMGKRKEAEDLLRLVQATQSNLPEIWRGRASRMASLP